MSMEQAFVRYAEALGSSGAGPETREVLGEALSELVNFFQLSLDLLAIAADDGYFQRLNPAWERVLGYETSELTSRPWIDFVHPGDVAATIQAAQGMNTQDVVQFSNRYRHKDGSYRWLSWNATRWNERGITYSVARDVTLLQESQLALQRTNREFKEWIRARENEREIFRQRINTEAEQRRRAEEVLREVSDQLLQTSEQLDQRMRELTSLNSLFQEFLTSVSATDEAAAESERQLSDFGFALAGVEENLQQLAPVSAS